MKRIQAVVFCTVICSILGFTGCVTPPTQEQIANLDYGSYPTDSEAIIKKYFDDILFDPYSAQYEFSSPETFWFKEAPLAGGRLLAGYIVRVSVNAKNRMGGYVGKEMYGFIIKDGQIIRVLNEFDLQNMRRAD
jgi:hypothetical protein